MVDLTFPSSRACLLKYQGRNKRCRVTVADDEGVTNVAVRAEARSRWLAWLSPPFHAARICSSAASSERRALPVAVRLWETAMSPSLHLPHPHHHHAPTTSTNAASHAPPASQKGQHYAETLDTIRRLALWTSQGPALTKGAVNYNAVPDSPEPASSSNGAGTTSMEWNEVLRKFRKHNPNRTSQFSPSLALWARFRSRGPADVAASSQSPPRRLTASEPSAVCSPRLARRPDRRRAQPIPFARRLSRRRSPPPIGPQRRKLSPSSKRLSKVHRARQ